MRKLLLFFPFVFLMACAPLDLERPDVDLHYGIRYDQSSSATAFPNNIAANNLPSALLVEIPVEADTNGLPSIPTLDFSPLAETGSTDLHLAFGSITDTLLFPVSQNALPAAWFPRLIQVIDTFLQSCSPKKVIPLLYLRRLFCSARKISPKRSAPSIRMRPRCRPAPAFSPDSDHF